METRNLCFACGELKDRSLEIYGCFLCETCERKLLQSDAGRHDYEKWIAVCRKIWKDLTLDLVELD